MNEKEARNIIENHEVFKLPDQKVGELVRVDFQGTSDETYIFETFVQDKGKFERAADWVVDKYGCGMITE